MRRNGSKTLSLSKETTRQPSRRNDRKTYVAHKPLPEGNLIWPKVTSSSLSLRLSAKSLYTFSTISVSYLHLYPTPNRKAIKKRGFPKISCPRVLYSWMQSGTVIRNLPSMIAMSLQLLSEFRWRRCLECLRSCTGAANVVEIMAG